MTCPKGGLHEWSEDLTCAKCGVSLAPPDTKAAAITEKRPAIEIIVKLRNKITADCDEAIAETLKQGEKK